MAIRPTGRRSAGYCHSNCGDHAKCARCEERDLERFERQIARHMRLILLGESNVPSVQFESLTIGKCREGRSGRDVDHHDVPLMVISDGFEDLVHLLQIDPLRFRAQGRD
jgi:hypothetical protein